MRIYSGMRGKHVRKTNGWWTLICWLLTAVFYSVSYFYAVTGTANHPNTFAWLVFLFLGWIWLYFALTASAQYLKQR